jgi:phosphatidylglycerol:prolipoprotein diacylglycerol transferase
MLNYPNINPVALQIGSFKIYWYGLMYLLGFTLAWCLGLLRTRKKGSHWNKEQVNDLIFYGAMGLVIGARIGYILFYDLSSFVAKPLVLFKIWQGGMSFHGGLIGAALGLWLFARKYKKTFFEVSDFAIPLVPLGLAAGRIGNFINGELWGRVTVVWRGMVFPKADALPRHPSQLYEFLFEGVILFAILWWYSSKPRPKMAVSGVFSVCYGFFRFILEFFRQPDPQLGFIAFGWLTMGQLLSIPLILLGFFLLLSAYYETILRFLKIH